MLDPEERERLLGPSHFCSKCKKPRIKHYCRSCDVFFFECACDAVKHANHRTYRWTPAGVIAIPDFDKLFTDADVH